MQLPLPRLSVLDEPTRQQISSHALAILKNKGFRVHSSALRQTLKTAGASVDDAREVVCLPPELVAEAVAATPGEFDMYDLDGHARRVGPGTVADHVCTYIEALRWLDHGASQLRPSTLADLRLGLQVAETLDLVAMTGPVVWPLEVPTERQLPETLLAILSSTRKSLNFGFQNQEHGELILEAVRMAAPALDLRRQPAIIFVSSPTSPLVFDRDSAEALPLGLEAGQVPVLAPCPMAGGTSQFSVIGTVLQQTAEVLFMLAVVHTLKPGAPVLWGGAGAAMDLRVGDVSYGGPERSLMMLANIDMAGHFGLPCHSPAASLDSCLIDAQCGAEKTWTYLTRMLSRAAMGMGVGAVTNGTAVSAEAMVIDADLIRCARRIAAGIQTGHLEQAAREIMAVAHGGNFMMADATMALMRDEAEYFIPPTFNRAGTAAPPLLERAHGRVEDITSGWHSPVPEAIVAQLERLLA